VLLLGDCLERMAELPDGAVDMVLCDLPYGTTACKWDAVIPFEPLWAHYRRVTKPNAAIVLTASQPFTSALVMSNPRWFRYELIWEKQKGSDPLNARRRPLKKHEAILVFAAAGTTIYNPQMTAGDPYIRRGDCRVKSENFSAAKATMDRGSADGLRFPTSVLKFPSEGMNVGNHHPTQKPVALMEYLIRTYTNEGDTVLDNTMGSGTTGVACANTRRKFIGIERDPTYFAIAEKRIAEAVPPLLAVSA
jgi:site-specific DNA-methyltransferase (adenine-specific)